MSEPCMPVDDAVVGDIEQFLQAMLQQLEPVEASRIGPGRPRILPSLCLWAGVVVCLLRGFTSQTAVWRLLTQGQFWFYPRFEFSDQAVFKRLGQGSSETLERLWHQVSAVLRQRLVPYAATNLAPWATEVVALDETTLDPIARALPSLRALPATDSRLLPGKLAGLFDLRYQQWRRLQYHANPLQNEKVAAREMLTELPKGSLILADLGYFGFAWFDDLTDQGQWWISRLRAQTSYTLLHTYYHADDTMDALIWLGAYRTDRAAHAVRLVQFRVGHTLHRYITNVCEPERLSLSEIATLYARRWDFELAVKLVKQHLKLHLLWSAKPGVILHQVWGVLIISQILQALQLEIAGRARVEPFDVSIALLVEYLPRLAYEGRDPVALFVREGRRLGFIRPSRRTKIQAPLIPLAKILHPPPELVVVRTPRYAERKSIHRTVK